MLSNNALFRAFALAALLLSAGLCQAPAQKRQEAPPVSRAVFWAGAEPEAEVYLVELNYSNYLLTVISKRELKVVYHTSINSVEPVEKELAPAEVNGNVRRYRFQHSFTKMTIWMALEFRLDGKEATALTRTFNNDIHDVTPNGHFNFGVRPGP